VVTATLPCQACHHWCVLIYVRRQDSLLLQIKIACCFRGSEQTFMPNAKTPDIYQQAILISTGRGSCTACLSRNLPHITSTRLSPCIRHPSRPHDTCPPPPSCTPLCHVITTHLPHHNPVAAPHPHPHPPTSPHSWSPSWALLRPCCVWWPQPCLQQAARAAVTCMCSSSATAACCSSRWRLWARRRARGCCWRCWGPCTARCLHACRLHSQGGTSIAALRVGDEGHRGTTGAGGGGLTEHTGATAVLCAASSMLLVTTRG